MEFKETKPLYLLKEIASILRSENGCAWDKEQTSKSLKPYLIEEAYEVYDAIDMNDSENLKEELGDLLYQIYAHSQIASESGLFTLDDVAEAISEKLIRRHPHVFGDEKAATANEVIEKWEKLKKKEKSGRQSILDGVPKAMPALLKAFRIQEKVSRIGFDWEKISDAELKLDEEILEFKEAVIHGSPEKISDEAGDILFSMVNVLRFTGVEPEAALNGTIKKFSERFKYIEKKSAEIGKDISEMSLPEMDDLWNEAKEKF
jgi:tetrapyrrole methylase family protein / MazG family protein